MTARAPSPIVSIAPMMDRTDRWFRRILRAVTQRSLLYTEMIVAQAIHHGDRERLLSFAAEEHPIALQLGGDDPDLLAEAARIGWEYGYDEINLNVGCPSDRVQQGRIGACLMAVPGRVAEVVAAMRATVPLPVTVKHRLGIDDRDSWEELLEFVDTVAAAGCHRFIVHARKAWLSGLSPKENREVPTLRRDWVHRLKLERPQLQIEVNGEIRSLTGIQEELRKVDAVMVGRAAVDDPWFLSGVDEACFGVASPARQPADALEALLGWIAAELESGVPLRFITRHLHGFFRGEPGAAAWRRGLSEDLRGNAGVADLERALLAMRRRAA